MKKGKAPTKAQKKKVNKVIEDRTFGLKNKNKSTTVQKFVKGVETTCKFNGMSADKMEQEQYLKKKLKKQKQLEEALLNSLYKDVNKINQMSDSEDEDPANVVCPYFKQGMCQKGKKCIYSHDLTLDRTEEIDLYVDQRTQLIMNAIGGKQLSQLSEDELNKMIGEKEREIIKGARSEILCKHFLMAAESGKYGWNWSCPAGGDRCKYKHCLPPGYRLKKDIGKEDFQVKVDLQAKIDEQRNNLLNQNTSSPLVTLDVFNKWKEQRNKKKIVEIQRKKKQQQKKNKHKGSLKTGRQLFSYDPSLFVDDEEAADDYVKEQEEEIKQQANEDDTQQKQELEKEEEAEEDEEN